MYRISLFEGGPTFSHSTGQMLAGTGQKCHCPLSGCAKEIYDPKTGYPDPVKLEAWNQKNYQAARDRKVIGAPMGSFESKAAERGRQQKGGESMVIKEAEAMIARLVARGLSRKEAMRFLEDAPGENFYKVRSAEAAADRHLDGR